MATLPYDLEEVKTAYASLTKLLKDDLKIEFDARRIKGTEYADVYEKLMFGALQLAFSAPEKAKSLEISDEQILNEKKKQELADRQIQGFDDNVNMKLTEMQMNAWSVMFSSGLLEEKPAIVEDDELSYLYSDLVSTVNKDTAFISGINNVKGLSVTMYTILNFDITNSYAVTTDVGTVSSITNNTFTFTASTGGTEVDPQESVITLTTTEPDNTITLALKKVRAVA